MDIGAGSGYFSVKLAEAGAGAIAADVDDEFQEFLAYSGTILPISKLGKSPMTTPVTAV